jgi:hypothetical protein
MVVRNFARPAMLTASTPVICRYLLPCNDGFIVNGVGECILHDNSRLGNRRSVTSQVRVGKDADDGSGRDAED